MGKEDKECALVGSHITRKQGWSGHNPHTVFLREAECDGDETTDDSHFTVRGCKGNTRSHALKNSVRLQHRGWH